MPTRNKYGAIVLMHRTACRGGKALGSAMVRACWQRQGAGRLVASAPQCIKNLHAVAMHWSRVGKGAGRTGKGKLPALVGRDGGEGGAAKGAAAP